MSGSVALNPKLLDKPTMPLAEEVKLEVPVKSLSLVDLEQVQRVLGKAAETINQSTNALQKLYDLNTSTDKQQLTETLQKTKEIADSFEEIKQVLNQIWVQVSKDSEKRNQAYDAVIRELGKT